MGRRKVLDFVQPQIEVPLSEAEVSIKARALATTCGEIDKLKADAADHASTERKKIRALEKQRRLLAECVRTRMEKRDAQENLNLREGDKNGKNKGKGGDALA